MSLNTVAITQPYDQTDGVATDTLTEYAPQNETNGVSVDDDLLEVLEQSAYAQDRDTFLDRIEGVDWSARPPEHILKAIDMALMIGGRARLAMQLAQESVRLFPDHPKCQWSARVIAPGKVVRRTPSDGKDRGMRASMDWVANHSRPYRGKWVAVSFGKVVASASSLEELDEMIKDEKEPDCILISKVF